MRKGCFWQSIMHGGFLSLTLSTVHHLCTSQGKRLTREIMNISMPDAVLRRIDPDAGSRKTQLLADEI